MQGGIEVQQATSKFSVGDKTYDAGSYVLYGAQAFRPYLADLLERQNYPELYLYPGGPPISPYDLTGWTLPMQMGVSVDRIDESFTAKTKEVTEQIAVSPGNVSGSASYGYVLENKENRSYSAVNKLISAGESVMVSDESFEVGKTTFAPGTFIIKSGQNTGATVKALTEELGVSFTGLKSEPGSSLRELGKVKVGLYKSWQANMDEGWTRFVLEQHYFDFDTLHNEEIISGDLSQYSAIIFPEQNPSGIINGHEPGSMPEPYVGGIGIEGLLALNNYTKGGGTLIMFGGASHLAIDQFALPVSDITDNLSRNSFFIPGSIVRIKNDMDHPISFGMQEEAGASFRRSSAFRIETVQRWAEGGREDVKMPPRPDVKVVSRYADSNVLMSGWGKGVNRIQNAGAVMDVAHGNGRVILFGFRPQFRAQPRGTYKLIFNSIYLGASKEPNGSSKTE